MSKRITGAIFCLMACIFFSEQYNAVMITWSGGVYSYMRFHLSRVLPLLILGLVSLCVGIWYIVTAEKEEKAEKKTKEKETQPDKDR